MGKAFPFRLSWGTVFCNLDKTVTGECRDGTPFTINVTSEQLFAWMCGEPIQRVMPQLSPDEREILKTGTSHAAWEAMFADVEDE